MLNTRAVAACTPDLIAVERPRAELHVTFLLVERKILHVNGARTFVDGRRNPQHLKFDSQLHSNNVHDLSGGIHNTSP